MQTLRIFVSSPADVSFERARAKQVVEKLGIEFAGRVKLEPFFWEHEPMRATDTFNGKANIPLTSEFDIVVCILWSRLGSLLGDTFRRPDGSRYPSGTVYEMEIARESYIKSKAPDLLVYRKTEELSLPMDNKELREQKLQQFEALEEFIQNWFFDKDNTFKSALTSYKKVSQFESMLEQHLRKLIALKIEKEGPVASLGAVDGRVNFASYHGGNPFRGLEPFDFCDSGLFFGRSLAIEEVLDALRGQAAGGFPLVVVNGVSGSGKSSLVRAGVVPVLMEPGVAEGIGLWRRADMRPSDAGEGLFVGLAKALFEKAALPELGKLGWSEEKLAAGLENEPEKVVVSIVQALRQAAADVQSDESLPQAPGSKLLLVLDQFEEVFSDERKISEPERKRFDESLATLLKSGEVWGIMTMRSDRMQKFQELEKLSEATRQHGQVVLMAPSETDLSLMIRLPARAAGLDFEQLVPSGERLEDRLLKGARDAPDGLPLLGFVLQELYRKMDAERRMLTFAALEELGGLEGAVASRAEAAFSEYGKSIGEEKAGTALVKLTRELTTLSEDAEAPPLRRVAELDKEGADADLDGLIATLVENRLLTRGVASGGAATVYVSHEAIFRKWPRLANLIESDRKFLETRRMAQDAAARWELRGRKSEFLWNRGTMLADAGYLLKNGEALDPREREFAVTSVASAKGRKIRNALVLSGVAAAAAAGFFLMPEKVVKEELSESDKAKIRHVEDRKKLDSLNGQLVTALAGIDRIIWPAPAEGDEQDEEWAPKPDSFPGMDVAEIANRIIAIDPKDNTAWKALLRADIVTASKIAKDDPEEGERRFAEIGKRFDEWKTRGLPKDELLDLKAQMAWLKGDSGEAVNLWGSYLKTPGLSDEARRRLYDVLSADRIKAGKSREALGLLDDWLEMEDNALARVRRAKLRLAEMDFTKAEADLNKAVELGPELREVREMVPQVERAMRYRSQVEEASKVIAKDGPVESVVGRCERARYFIAMEQYDAAAADLKEAGKRVRGGSFAIEILQGILASRSGKGNGENSRINPLGVWSYEEGCEKFLEGNWERLMGMLKLDMSIGLPTSNADTRLERGWNTWGLGQHKMSLADAEAALKIAPGHGEARMLRIASVTYIQADENLLAECDAAARDFPAWSGFPRFKSEILFRMDRTEEALGEIDKAIALEPEASFFNELRAQYLDKLGRADEAVAARKRGLELNQN